MTIGEIIRKCANDIGIASCVVGKTKEINYKLENTDTFPVLLVWFNWTERPTDFVGEMERQATFTVAELLPDQSSPDCQYDVLPATDRMSELSLDFVERLKSYGIEVTNVQLTPNVYYFDRLLAGVTLNVTMTYNAKCLNDRCDGLCR